jgi:hypothetical protein
MIFAGKLTGGIPSRRYAPEVYLNLMASSCDRCALAIATMMDALIFIQPSLRRT